MVTVTELRLLETRKAISDKLKVMRACTRGRYVYEWNVSVSDTSDSCKCCGIRLAGEAVRHL
jgi:hypothetical protein